MGHATAAGSIRVQQEGGEGRHRSRSWPRSCTLLDSRPATALAYQDDSRPATALAYQDDSRPATALAYQDDSRPATALAYQDEATLEGARARDARVPISSSSSSCLSLTNDDDLVATRASSSLFAKRNGDGCAERRPGGRPHHAGGGTRLGCRRPLQGQAAAGRLDIQGRHGRRIRAPRLYPPSRCRGRERAPAGGEPNDLAARLAANAAAVAPETPEQAAQREADTRAAIERARPDFARAK